MNGDEQGRVTGTLSKVAYGVLAVALVVLSIVIYWLTSARDVLEIKNQPVPVRSIRQHPEADGVIIVHTNYCQHVAATARIRISFVSPSREVFLPADRDVPLPKKCEDIEVPVLIPKELPPGKYHLHWRIEYKVNPLKHVIEEFDSVEFEVVEGAVK